MKIKISDTYKMDGTRIERGSHSNAPSVEEFRNPGKNTATVEEEAHQPSQKVS